MPTQDRLAQTFDGICARASLLHLDREEIPAVMTGFKRVLKSQGIIHVLVKEGRGSEEVSEALSSNQTRFFTYFSLSEMKHFFKTAGFNIIDSYTYNGRDRDTDSRDLNWVVVFAQKP
jgi:hypothetical protein